MKTLVTIFIVCSFAVTQSIQAFDLDAERVREAKQVELWRAKLADLSESDSAEKLSGLWLGLRNMGHRKSIPNHGLDVDLLYREIQKELISIPGHARYFADELAEARRKSEKPWLDGDYQMIFSHTRDTMIHLPSPETIWVVGAMLESEEDRWTTEERVAIWKEQGEKGFRGAMVPSPLIFAGAVLGGIGLRESSGYPPKPSMEAVLEWWSRVKSGEIGFSFEGQAEEYRFRPDGTWDTIPIANPTGALATPPQSVRRERAQKGRITPEAPQSTSANGTFRTVMMVIGVLIIGSVAWLWKVRRARLN